jgi:xanthine dehydrogenase accessory factor
MKAVFAEINRLLAGSEPFALATVIASQGSTPRSAGAKMVVRGDGSTCGTVGGGILEAQVEALALQVLQSGENQVRDFRFSGKDAATMDAICGGQAQVLVERIDPHEEDAREAFAAAQQAAQARSRAWLVSGLPPARGHALVRSSGETVGSLPAGIDLEAVCGMRQTGVIEPDLLVEPLGESGTAYIFGAGHVSRSLAEFVRAVGFRTVVLDDRPEFAAAERFPAADERIVLASFEDAFAPVQVDEDSYVLIITRGHLHDLTVLAQALRTRAAYIGMIGSRRKTRLVFDALLKEGFSEEDLQRVHAPVGLPIGAETPEEIGISITAELIQVRAGVNRSRRAGAAVPHEQQNGKRSEA